LDAYTWTGLGALDVPPSPNVHAYVSGSFSGSLVPALEKLTDRGEGPVVGCADTDTNGGWLFET
jgi:hypothetical protein